jgi:hypothetical protein
VLLVNNVFGFDQLCAAAGGAGHDLSIVVNSVSRRNQVDRQTSSDMTLTLREIVASFVNCIGGRGKSLAKSLASHWASHGGSALLQSWRSRAFGLKATTLRIAPPQSPPVSLRS